MNTSIRPVEAPILETERLILRRPRLEDFEAHYAFYGDPESTRYLGGVRTREGARRHLEETIEGWERFGVDKFAIEEKATGALVGRVGPKRVDGFEQLEVGWNIAAAYRGRGYAREAAIAAMNHAFGPLNESRVIHLIHPNNHISKRLARRLGSGFGGSIVSTTGTGHEGFEIWGQSAAEWRACSR